MSELELIAAVKSGNTPLIKTLIQSRTDVNQQDDQGWTPLNWAAAKGNSEVVKLLLQKGADVFKTGRDLRTPAMIALAAGQAKTAEILLEAESKVEGEKPAFPQRKFCTAYPIEEFRQFPGWTENQDGPPANRSNGSSHSSAAPAEASADDGILFLHQNYVVTKSIWDDEQIVFNQFSEDWKTFCHEVLQFRVPDDLDLIAERPASNASSKSVKAGIF
jgi:uncharacterized protein